MFEFDGAMGEGGGAILRVGAGLACTTNQPVRFKNIRKNRKMPGLRLQHLLGIQTVARITNGQTTPLEIGTTELDLIPGSEWKPKSSINVSTAGNIGLLCQTIHTALFLAPPREYIIDIYGGGTFGKFAPGVSYVQNLTYPLMNKLGFSAALDITKHGFYPKGGAKARLVVRPSQHYHPLNLVERGELTGIYCEIHGSAKLQKPQVGERIAEEFTRGLSLQLKAKQIPPKISIQYHHTMSSGVEVDAWLEFEGGARVGTGTILGARGISSEIIGKRVAYAINNLELSHSTLDEYLSDQIIPFLAIIPEESQFVVDQVSSHTQTNLDLVKQFLGCEYSITKQTTDYLIKVGPRT